MLQRILFVCTKNAVRSPMAEALAERMRVQAGLDSLRFASAGIDPSDVDGFTISVMAEIGCDLLRHESQDLSDIEAGQFDVLIALSAYAGEVARARFAPLGKPIEMWPVAEPRLVEENYDQQLAAYREVREAISVKLRQRFALS